MACDTIQNDTMTTTLDNQSNSQRARRPAAPRSPGRETSSRASHDDRPKITPASRRRRGAVTVETGIVLPVCLLFLLGLFDFSRVVTTRQIVTNAAREGCRYAIVNTSEATTGQVQSYVTNYLAGQQINNLVINVYQADPTTGNNLGSWNDAGLSSSVGVQITGTVSTITPTFSMLPSTVPVQAVAIMASEGN